MKRMLINAKPDDFRVAIANHFRLIDLYIEIPGQEQKIANIYKGVISSIEPSLGAVFVNYTAERHGFLPLKEISREYFLQENHQDIDSIDINQVLKVGQEVVVQVEKEERGTKGAALTTFISLAGSFLVLMPNNPRAGGISRRIEGDERDQLREILSQLEVPEGMGLIVRTAGLGRAKEELEWDLKILLRYWEAIKQAAIAKPGPYLIHQESDLIVRAIRDYLRQDIDEIFIDNEEAYTNARHYINQVRPHFVERLKLYNDTLPLFTRFQIEQQIENAHQREIRLPSGGSLIIDQNEALVAIDINSARATRADNIEETAVSTNMEAAEEIARQLRIRDIGGLIVIDFIDMKSIQNQRKVENCLRNALKQDRARVQIGRISQFGLLEMSRQRLRSSLTRATQITCPRCNGEGAIRSVESLSLSILHLIQEQASKTTNICFQLQAPVDLATYLINEKREALREIEQSYSVKITIIPNQYMETPFYQLKQLKKDANQPAHLKGTPSYKLTKMLKLEPSSKQESKPLLSAAEPAIQQFLTPGSETPQKTANTTTTGLFKRLMAKMFGPEKEPSQKARTFVENETPKSHSKRNERNYSTQQTPPSHPHKSTAQNSTRRRRYRSNNASPSTSGRSRRGTRGGQRDYGKNGSQQARIQASDPADSPISSLPSPSFPIEAEHKNPSSHHNRHNNVSRNDNDNRGNR